MKRKISIILVSILVFSLFSAIVLSKSAKFDDLESFRLVYANKFEAGDLIKVRGTYGIVELHFKPNPELKFPPEPKFLTFEEYKKILSGQNWFEGANPLNYFTEEELKDYYQLRVEGDRAYWEWVKKTTEEGSRSLHFYLKIEDGLNTYQFFDFADGFYYYERRLGGDDFEYEKDEDGYALIERIETNFSLLNPDGSTDQSKTVFLNAVFDKSGLLIPEKTQIEFQGVSSGLTDLLAKVGTVRKELQPISTKKFTDYQMREERRIMMAHWNVFKKMEQFNLDALKVVQNNGKPFEFINEYLRPIKTVVAAG